MEHTSLNLKKRAILACFLLKRLFLLLKAKCSIFVKTQEETSQAKEGAIVFSLLEDDFFVNDGIVSRFNLYD